MATAIELSFDDVVLQKTLTLLRRRTDDNSLGPLLGAIGATLEDSTRRRFIDQKDPDGRKWKPSARALAQGGQTLRNRGILMGSLTHAVSGRTVEYGVLGKLPYARIHQTGGVIKAKNGLLKYNIPGVGWRMTSSVEIPQRAYLGINADDKQAIRHDIVTFLRSST